MVSQSGKLVGGQAELVAIMFRKYYLVAFWVETMIYGAYVFLFIAAMNIMRKRRDLGTFSSRFYLACVSLMFVIITLHNFVNVYRLIQAFVKISNPVESINYIRNCAVFWDCYLFGITLATLSWITEALMIYRVWLVWQRDYRAIVLPCFLMMAALGIGLFGLWWFQHPFVLPLQPALTVVGLPFVIGFAQNVITTGLITFRIYSQHRRTLRAGGQMASHSTPDLFMVTRIIIESAMFWTLQLLVISVLYFAKHPAEIIVQHASIPSAGIIFVLVAVRTEYARSHSDLEDTPSCVRQGGADPSASFVLSSWVDTTPHSDGLAPGTNAHSGLTTFDAQMSNSFLESGTPHECTQENIVKEK